MKQQKKFMEAMLYRYATKEFNSSKKIEKEDMENILEVGRLSPSSFGLEHWKFIDVKNKDLKEKLQEASFNQKQVSTASDVVIFLAKKKDLRANSQYVKEIFESRMSKDMAKSMIGVHTEFVSSFSEEKFDEWCKKQNYIPAANMMTYAASIGIDSCPMEGFSEENVLNVLGLNREDYGVALIVPFGFRKEEPKREKLRLSFEDIIEVRE